MNFEMRRRTANAFEGGFYLIGAIATVITTAYTVKTQKAQLKATEIALGKMEKEDVEEVVVEKVTED